MILILMLLEKHHHGDIVGNEAFQSERASAKALRRDCAQCF